MTHYNEVKTCRVFGHQVRTLLTLLLVLGGGEAMAQVTIHGSVYGGGNQAAVKTNTSVNISDGKIVGTIDPDNEGKLVAHTGNVYGGGDSGPVKHDTEVNVGVTFSTNATTMSIPQAGISDNSKTITVTSNVTWTVKSSASWLTVSPGSGKGNGTITVKASANTGEGATARTATITITGAGETKTVTVTQAAPPSGD